MVLNDKILTFATAAFLAIGGGAVSIYMGDHGATKTDEGTPTVIAAMNVPSVSGGPSVLPKELDAPRTARDLPDVTVAETAVEAPYVFASVEPKERKRSAAAGADLVEVAVADGAPELAVPAEIRDIVLTRALAPIQGVELPRYSAGIPTQAIDIAQALSLPTVVKVKCGLDVRATPIFGARVQLKVNAPCHPNVVLTIEHGGLRFKERLDQAGLLALKVPAFERYAKFEIQLADGTHKTVGAYVAGLASMERVGIAWAGGSDTYLHAFQQSAKPGDKNHVWQANTRDFVSARMNGGGYMTLLGAADLENARMVQVYTLPTSKQNAGSLVSLGIETLRGEKACGERMKLTVARHSAQAGASKSKLSLVLPECGTENSSLLLKNVLKDMKVALK